MVLGVGGKVKYEESDKVVVIIEIMDKSGNLLFRNKNGEPVEGHAIGAYLLRAINHPERLSVICNPRFTPKEVERAKAIRVLYPKVTGVALEGSRAVPGSGEVFFFAQEEQFPSLELNETVKLDDIIGGAE